MSDTLVIPETGHIKPASQENVHDAAMRIRKGELVAFPTETVYGLGADATSDDAVAAIFEAKGRPKFNPLIIHFADAGQAALAVQFDDRARKLAEAFWPGPLTMVLPRLATCTVSLLASAGLDTLAVRVPAHPVARALLALSERPLAAPSANRSGTTSPTTAMHVSFSLHDKVPTILDGGSCEVGIESTIIDLSTEQAVLLRPGGVTVEDISALIGPVTLHTPDDTNGGDDKPKAPGMLARHYAPSIPLRMNVTPEERKKGEAFLTFGPDAPRRAALNLSRKGDLREAAANLFIMIRTLDQPGIRGIAVMPIPNEGLGLAINDRLRRAAQTPSVEEQRNAPSACDVPPLFKDPA